MSVFSNLFGSGNQKERDKPKVLAELRSPNCPITAIVEQDNQVAYFYLWGDEGSEFGVKACWLRNLDEAPIENDIKQIEAGIPPMLTKAFCKFSGAQKPFNAEDLEIVWLEEGDGAALLEKNEVIGIIPAWAILGQFPGYARDCVGESDLCWELTTTNFLHERIYKAKEFWESWDNEISPFQILQPELLKIYEETLGNSEKYYAIDGNQWPPRGLFLKNGESKDVFVTVGLSILPMPVAELYSENPKQIDRIELGLMLNAGLPETTLTKIGSWISGQASIPWGNISWLGNGHTITFNILENTKFTAVILVKDLNVLPKLEIENYRDSNVNVLWMIPITENERNFVRDMGCEILIEKLNNIGSEIFNIHREELKLS